MAFAVLSKPRSKPQGPAKHVAQQRSTAGGLLQRKCAYGGQTITGGEREECSKKKWGGLQTKLQVDEPGDAYEREADRVGDQVLAKPVRPALSDAPVSIQRLLGVSAGRVNGASHGVGRALASASRPLEPALRRDMEQRFGYDFSKVRLHSGPAAERSAREVNAQAYTVGTDIVFGAGRFVSGSQEGRRLLAHELTHVVQQSGGEAGLAGHAVASLAVQRKPNAGPLSEAKDPIDEDDYPDYGWYYLMTGSSHGAPTFGYVRGVVRENTDVDRELLEEAAPELHYRKFVKGGTIRPSYFAFRHPTKGVVARAFAELDGYHPELAPKGKELLKEAHPYKFYAFMPREGNHRPLYSFSMPLSSAPPAPELPERKQEPEKKDEPAAKSEKAPASGTVTWMEIHEGVFGVIVEGGLSLKVIGAYVSGHPDVPDALADLNGIGVAAPIPNTKPIMIPYEFVERRETLEKIPEPIRSRIFLLRKRRAENAAIMRFVKVQRGHSVGLIPLTTETIRATVNGLKHLANKAAYLIAFVVGVIHGLLSSIWDAASGVAKMIYSIVKSLITGGLISDIQDFASTVRNLSLAGVKEALGNWAAGWDAKLKSPSPWTSGHALGYLVGYVIAEVIMFLLSDGLIEELKGAIWATKLGEALKESRLLRTVDKGLTKAAEAKRALGAEFGKAVEAAKKSSLGRKVLTAAEKTGAVVSWTADMAKSALKLPADIANSVAGKVAANAERLRPFFRRIEELTDQAKHWLFGCHSRCDWEANAVAASMKRLSNDTIEKVAKSAPSKVVTGARQRVAETETSLAAARRDVEKARQKVVKHEEDLGVARQLAGEPGGAELLSKTQGEVATAQKELARLENSLEMAESHAVHAIRGSRNIEILEPEIAEVDQKINEIYARNRQYKGQMNKADREALRNLENKKKDLVGELQKEVKSLSRNWIDQLREGTPGEGAAEKAVQNLGNMPAELRTADGHPFDIADPSGAVLTDFSPDHIYAFDRIIREPGFFKLTPDQQRRVLELKENYLPLTEAANKSKGSRTMAGWFRTPIGRKIPIKLRKPLEDAERRAQKAIRDFIANPY